MIYFASVFLQDMQRLPEAIQYIEKASMMYIENGTPDTAAMALDRAGKWVITLDKIHIWITLLQKNKVMITCILLE